MIETLIRKGLVPDPLLRAGIRRLLAARLAKEGEGGAEAVARRHQAWVDALKRSDIAVHTDAANEQHYEVPAAFFERVLGKHLKYSAGLWREGGATLDEAEAAMLELTVERGRLEDGMDVLDLGCGWGSLSLWIAERFPRCRVLGVSNSAPQRAFILGRAAERGLSNLEIVTSDVSVFDTDRRFDRVFSVEMFEHVRNYRALLAKIASWMKPEALLFVHIFTHERFAYPFETEGAANWMGRNFFTGGQMPSDHLLLYFQDDVILQEHWRVNGRHYARTARAWLERVDRDPRAIEAILAPVAPDGDAAAARRMWRVFFLACEELWRYRGGDEWFVSHYLFSPRNEPGTFLQQIPAPGASLHRLDT